MSTTEFTAKESVLIPYIGSIVPLSVCAYLAWPNPGALISISLTIGLLSGISFTLKITSWKDAKIQELSKRIQDMQNERLGQIEREMAE